MSIRIGTRGSKLALWQANHVREVLGAIGIQAELVLYNTAGDLQQFKPLHQIGETGLFTKALDDALIAGEIDLAVHSAKDMPSVLPKELSIVAISKREDPRDVLLSSGEETDLDNLSSPISIGTSSLRRMAFLKHYLPHIKIVPMRGNIDTRVEKMLKGECDGILLAYAGVKRMGLSHLVTRKLNVSTFTPAVGQGAIAMVMRDTHPRASVVRAALNDEGSEIAVTAERAFLRTLEGGCQKAIFALATVVGETLNMTGGVAREDGSAILRDTIDGSASGAAETGHRLAQNLLKKGARDILHGKEN